jgi:ABC-type uncharacterized transport system substrate-binding protein
MAARGTRAATGKCATHWCSQWLPGRRSGNTGSYRGIPAGHGGSWLERGPQPADRLSLGWCRRRPHQVLRHGVGRHAAGRDTCHHIAERRGIAAGQGFVASLGRPGGNITGFTGFEFSLGEKWLGLLKELAPGLTRVAFVFHPEMGPFHLHWLNSVKSAAANFGVETSAAPVRTAAELKGVISAIATAQNGGLVVEPDAYTFANARLIIELAARYQLPAIYGYPHVATEGGLVSYGPDAQDLYRRSAVYIDRILEGEKPADLPVQQPLKYELLINLKTANSLGLTVPLALQMAADQVIE